MLVDSFVFYAIFCITVFFLKMTLGKKYFIISSDNRLLFFFIDLIIISINAKFIHSVYFIYNIRNWYQYVKICKYVYFYSSHVTN